MSLLLDALKEAEARKRGVASTPGAEASFETHGTLALAEDIAPDPVPRSEAAAPASSADAPQRAAAAPVAAQPRARNTLPWLIGVVGLLLLLLGGFALFDVLANRPDAAPAVAAAPESPLSGRSASLAGEITLQPLPAPVDESAPRAAPARAAQAASGRFNRPVPASSVAATPAGAERLSISREPAPLAAAWTALHRGDVEQAERLYRRVLDAEPGQVDAELGLAVIAHSRGDDEGARRGYRRVLESVPDHPRAWAGLAELVGDGELGQIESRLRQLLADRAAAPLHFALGNVLARQQRWADAQLEYFAAASLEPGSPDYAFNVAVALERIGKSGAALSWYRRANGYAAEGRAARFDTAAARDRIAQLEVLPP